jgi:nucleotidyltransferase/DNA polymerase involved in DNA repair
VIACVRIPYFIAAVESRERSAMDTAPFALIRSQDSRRELFAFSQEAAQYGVRPGMTLTQAQAVCPNIQILPARPTYYDRAIEEMLETLSTFSPQVEIENSLELRADARKRKAGLPVVQLSQVDEQSSGIFFVDLGKISQEEAFKLAHKIQESLARLHLTAAISIAANKFTARTLAFSLDAHEVFAVRDGKEAEFLKSFSVSLLPADGEIIRQLILLGLESLGQLAELPVSALQSQFGKQGRTLHRLANGRDTSAVAHYTPKIVKRMRHTFEDPAGDRLIIENVLSRMVGQLSTQLQIKNEAARKVELVIATDQHEVIERRLVLREPLMVDSALLNVTKELFQSIQVSGPVTGVEIILSGIAPIVGRQMSLFEREPVSHSKLHLVLKDLVARYGEDSFYLLKLTNQDARLPERRFSLEKAAESDSSVA